VLYIVDRVKVDGAKLVSKEVWGQASPEERGNLLIDTVCEWVLVAMSSIERRSGIEELALWSDFNEG